jgi:hypothetical protein
LVPRALSSRGWRSRWPLMPLMTRAMAPVVGGLDPTGEKMSNREAEIRRYSIHRALLDARRLRYNRVSQRDG